MTAPSFAFLKQYRDYIVEPALEAIGLNSQARMRLVIGTGLQESNLHYIDQLDKAERPGPAYGVFQMEKATHEDIWRNFLSKKTHIRDRLDALMIRGIAPVEQLHGNAYYAAAMCGIFYLRFPEALPDPADLGGMAYYWKKYYNTHLGKGTEEQFMKKAEAILKL